MGVWERGRKRERETDSREKDEEEENSSQTEIDRDRNKYMEECLSVENSYRFVSHSCMCFHKLF